jgi:UDP-N-acetylglucosamine acyltransferase
MANVYLEGPTSIGENNIFYPYSTVGVAPQDLKYKGEVSETRIGNRTRSVNLSRFTGARKAEGW